MPRLVISITFDRAYAFFTPTLQAQCVNRKRELVEPIKCYFFIFFQDVSSNKHSKSVLSKDYFVKNFLILLLFLFFQEILY